MADYGCRPVRIAENFDVFDFELIADELAAVDALDTGRRSSPDPELIDRTTYTYVVET